MAAPAPPALIEGDGEAVVLVHAFPLDGRMWTAQAATLRDRFRVIIPDVLGFGPPGANGRARSGVGEPQPSLDEAADGIATLLDELGVERAVLCGCSMGGYIAFAFLRRHPGRLRGLVLVDTKAAADTVEVRRARLVQAERVLAEGVGFLPEALLPNVLGATSLATRAGVVEQVTRLILEQEPAAVARALRAMAARPDSSELLPAIAVPTLVVAGEEDVTTPAEGAQALAATIPGAKFAKIFSAGHLPSIEVPDELDRALLQFLTELGQTTP
jgi:pimeloyl-ACP methyl ester carboxylesterase